MRITLSLEPVSPAHEEVYGWLESQSADPVPFTGWEWQRLAHQHLHPRSARALLVARDGSELRGAILLSRVAGVWRSGAAGVSDLLPPVGPLSHHEWRQLIHRYSNEFGESFDLWHWPGSEVVIEPREHPDSVTQFPDESWIQAERFVVDLPSEPERLWESLPSALRRDVRRGFRHADLEMAWVQADRFWPEFLRLHGLRWRSRRQLGGFVLPSRQKLHEEWLGTGEGRDRSHLGLLLHQGQAIGAIYGLLSGRRAWFYQSGMDPAAKALCPGSVALAHWMQRALELGAERMDLGKGLEPYKLRWQPTIIARNERVLHASSSLQHWGLRVSHQVETVVRAKLEGTSRRKG